MADLLKVLGQVEPASATWDVLYTVPALKQTTVSSLIVCDTGGAADTYRVAVDVGGTTGSPPAGNEFIFYDTSINSNTTDKHVIGMTLSEGDVVRVYDANGNLTFTLFGVETS